MSNHKCRSIMYECTKLTPNIDIFPDEMKVIMENNKPEKGSINAFNDRNFIRAFDEFNTFASSFTLYRTDKATYYRSVLNTLWNGPSCYFRQLVKGDVKCENPWLSIVAAAHPGTIINILKEENNQLGADGLFARFIFSARISPEDVHKRCKREINNITGGYTQESYSYPTANEVLIRTHNEYNNILIEFQGYEDIICTLFSKSCDHLYRICGLLHLFHQACIYVLKARPQLEYLVFDDTSAESIQQIVKLAQENINDYLTISPDIAQTAVELMKFYVETKKLLHGFPLKNHSSIEERHIGPSASQEANIERSNEQIDGALQNNNNNDNNSVLSNNSNFSSLVSSICPFDGRTMDATIEKILLYNHRIISSNRVAQMLRRPNVNSQNVKKVFIFLSNCQMGTYKIEKQKKGKPRSLFIKADLPEDKE
ncbi:unnamed protein product, partial [Rotaria sp. Silwood2]